MAVKLITIAGETSMTEATARYLDIFESIARDPKYAHFINIPQRIIKCLDDFAIQYQSVEVTQRLRAYYLFIGIIDEAIDSGDFGIGASILSRLQARIFPAPEPISLINVACDVLMQNIDNDIYPAVRTEFGRLYKAAVNERNSRTIAAYIEQRKIVGRLTARLSYLLIHPFLANERKDFCRFMEEVGAVGCLVDSLIDFRTDVRQGLVSFDPTTSNFMRLLAHTLREGWGILWRHPGLGRVFLEALSDNLRDRSRAHECVTPPVIAAQKEGVPSLV